MDSATIVNSESIKYGGFWRRLIALIDFFFPNQIVVKTPFGLFSEDRVLETHKSILPNADGSQTAVETKIVQRTYMNRWTYTYRVIKKSTGGESKSESQLVDPITKQDISKTSTGTLQLFGLLIYLIVMEGSRHQASLGKLALGLKVVDMDGQRLTFLRAAGRNVSKLLSVFTLFIGFMMAGWTNKKQALHDMVAQCLVISVQK
jgi:hypothetical protein